MRTSTLLHNHADAVINRGEKFKAGESFTIDGVVCAYEEVSGDQPNDPMRLRIVDVPGACRCACCGAQERTADDQLQSKHTTTPNEEV